MASSGAPASKSTMAYPRRLVAMREARDAKLSAPKVLPSIQVNVSAGRWPDAEANGVSYLKIPVRLTGET